MIQGIIRESRMESTPDSLLRRGAIVRAFGPVPSRRLGRSLGVNNIPPKVCTFSCVYCQLGRTQKMGVDRQVFYDPTDLAQEVQQKVGQARQVGEGVDYVTFVPDGEPTLDIHLGREIELLKPLGIPIAVITNASLVWREDVRADLRQADWVSLKVDAVRQDIWRRVDRPHRSLGLPSILDGVIEFARSYRGTLVTESMLVAGVNDDADSIRDLAVFLGRLRLAVAYVSIPIRPPAEKRVRAPNDDVINRAVQILASTVPRVEYLIGYEGNAFAFTGDVERDLLSITAVHPMREDAMAAFLERAGADWTVVQELVAKGQLVEIGYEGHGFYMRKLGRRPSAQAVPSVLWKRGG